MKENLEYIGCLEWAVLNIEQHDGDLSKIIALTLQTN